MKTMNSIKMFRTLSQNLGRCLGRANNALFCNMLIVKEIRWYI